MDKQAELLLDAQRQMNRTKQVIRPEELFTRGMYMKTMQNYRSTGLGLLAAVVILSACLPNLPPRRNDDPNSLYTAAAETIVADVTLSAGRTAIAQLTQIAQGTPAATQPRLPSLTSSGSSPTNATPSPTFIPPTNTPLPTVTFFFPTATSTQRPPPPPPTPVPCDWAQYVKDVTVPDGTIFIPSSNFTKVWRLKNIGNCTWTASYALVFSSGEKMGGKNVVPMPGLVRPGESVDVAVDLGAPSLPGKYRGYWMLSNHFGQIFGIGANANKPFWVDIQVLAVNSPYAYDFALNMCAATWRSSTANLPCPGTTNSGNGYIQLLLSPQLETGRQENEQTLLTQPELLRGGLIQGKYPFYRVQNGDHFLADIGCLYNSPGCDVTFFLSYQVRDNPVKDLGSWHEIYEGQMKRLDVDLSFLADKQVSFILSVINNGKPSEANAIWFVPSIRKGSAPPWWENLTAVSVARQLIAQSTGIHINQITVTYVEQVQWSDTCLGVHLPDQVCAAAIIPGYRILLTAGNRKFEAHTDLEGNTVFWFEL